MKQLTSANAREWQHYNRWRSKHRALDRQLRLDRIAAKEQARLAGFTLPKCALPRKPAAWATVIIRFGTGRKMKFSIHETPWLSQPFTISPTLAGRKVSAVLGAMPQQNLLTRRKAVCSIAQ